jgi:alpha-beta hydrolase superfamily lysophospholipase
MACGRQARPYDLFRIEWKRWVTNAGRLRSRITISQLDRTKAGAHDYTAVHVPIVILHGTKDGVVPVRGSHKLRAKYANVLLHEYPGAGHWLFEEVTTSDAIFTDLTLWLTKQNFA